MAYLRKPPNSSTYKGNASNLTARHRASQARTPASAKAKKVIQGQNRKTITMEPIQRRKRIAKCWSCNLPSGLECFLLTHGTPGDRKILGYFCGKDCLAAFISKHWEKL